MPISSRARFKNIYYLVVSKKKKFADLYLRTIKTTKNTML
jgi:hypothetical protein